MNRFLKKNLRRLRRLKKIGFEGGTPGTPCPDINSDRSPVFDPFLEEIEPCSVSVAPRANGSPGATPSPVYKGGYKRPP